MLENLQGLGGLVHIEESLSIDDNKALSDLAGLEDLTGVGWDLIIAGNDKLGDITALSNLLEIESLKISHNPSLKDLTGLDNLNHVTPELEISENATLKDISALGGSHFAYSSYVWNKISITNNGSLEDLAGLEGFHPETIDELIITGNESLSSCSIENICEYIFNPENIYIIENNAEGCDNRSEVLEECETVTIEELADSPDMFIYPNPSSGEIHLRYSISDPSTSLGTGSRYAIFEVFSIQGIKVRTLLSAVRQPGEYEMSFDISELPDGMYFVRMQLGRRVEMVKVVKVGSKQ